MANADVGLRYCLLTNDQNDPKPAVQPENVPCYGISCDSRMASASAVVLQFVYAVAAVLAYILLEKLSAKRKQTAWDKQQKRLARQQAQQAEVQHRGDSANESLGASPESLRPKEASANSRSNAAHPLPQSVFSPEPTMLELPSLPSDWEIQLDQLVIAQRPDGSPWELGTGAFGKVSQQTGAGCYLVVTGPPQCASSQGMRYAGVQGNTGRCPDRGCKAIAGTKWLSAAEVCQ